MISIINNIYYKNEFVIKTFFLWVYPLIVKPLTFVMLGANLVQPSFIFYFMIFIMFIPEYMFAFSQSFREWLKGEIEHKPKKDDTNFSAFLMNYSALWCIRLYVLFGLLEAFAGIEVREIWVNTSLIGAFGIKTIETINFFKRKT